MDLFTKWSPFMMLKTEVEMPDWKPSLSSAKRVPFVELLADRPENNVGLAFLFTQCLSLINSFESDSIFFLDSPNIPHPKDPKPTHFFPFRLQRISIKRLCWVETNPAVWCPRQSRLLETGIWGLTAICDELLQWEMENGLEKWTPKNPTELRWP